MYGWGANEELLAAALHPYPDDLLIATKVGISRTDSGEWMPAGRPDALRAGVDQALRRLRTDRLDLLQLHRIDPAVPLADQLGALREQQDAGKVGQIGLSEVTVAELAEARSTVDVASVQNRYNVLDRQYDDVVGACTQSGIAFLPWRPVAVTGTTDELAAVAAELDATVAQVCLAWLLDRSPVVLPIPGTASIAHLEENVAAADLQLSPEQRQRRGWSQFETSRDVPPQGCQHPRRRRPRLEREHSMSSIDQQSGASTAGGASRLTTWHHDLFTAVGQWPWLHSLNESVTAVVQPLYDRHRDNVVVEMMHGGRWAGHSLHAALSDLPIGFWAGSVVLDMVGQDVPTGGRRMDPAGTLSAAGILAAVGTVATGVTDWTVSDDEDRRVGLFHGLLNVVGLTLQTASLAARLAGHRRPAQVLGLASMTVTGAAGYVGGHLVQGRAVMVNRVATFSGPNRWVRAISDEDLKDDVPVAVDVDGRQVLLHRSAGELHCLDNTCTHAGGLLSRGEFDGCTVECPLHGARFDLRDGRIVRGPAHHPQPVLPTRVRNGWIEVRGSQPRSRRAKT